jgi:general secretion pathway protein C
MIRTSLISRLVVGIYVLLAAFILAHSVNAFVEYALEVPQSAPPPASLENSADLTTRDSQAHVQSILASRLFPVPANIASASGLEQTTPPLPPLDVAKKFLLIGTAVNPVSGGHAILEDLSSKTQAIYHSNDMVGSVGMIVQIQKDRVLFKNQQQEEWLPIGIQQLQPGFERRIEPSSVMGRPAVAVLSAKQPSPPVSSTKFTIDRKELVFLSQNHSVLINNARLVPILTNRHPDGLAIEGMNHFSIYGRLGFVNGDVLKRINGVEVNDVQLFASIFQRLNDERVIRIDILRDSQRKTLTVDVL